MIKDAGTYRVGRTISLNSFISHHHGNASVTYYNSIKSNTTMVKNNIICVCEGRQQVREEKCIIAD